MLARGQRKELKKRDMVRPKHDKPPGVLHSDAASAGMVHARYWPSPDLATFVEHYWTVEWNLAAPLRRETLPHPVVHIVLLDAPMLVSFDMVPLDIVPLDIVLPDAVLFGVVTVPFG